MDSRGASVLWNGHSRGGSVMDIVPRLSHEHSGTVILAEAP